MSDVELYLSSNPVSINLGTYNAISGGVGLTTLKRIVYVAAVGEVGMSNLAEGTISGVLTITKTGTTARTVTFPDAAITVARTDAAQTFTGVQTITDGALLPTLTATISAGVMIKNLSGQLVAVFGAGDSQACAFSDGISCAMVNSTSASGIQNQQASAQDAIAIKGRAGGTGSYIATLTPPTLSASITLTMPAVTGTLAILGANSFTGAQTFADDLNMTGAKYLYLRGDGSTDGSVRISSAASGTAQIEARAGGSWAIIASFA